MMAVPKTKVPQTIASPRRDQVAAMADPPHPMHQELLRRVTAADMDAGPAASIPLSRPARLATIFYLGLGSWGLLGLLGYSIVRLA
ncbi:hypothetical protein [uncultured Sphingomonas sp.]|uniref:hypothetical protein n=1 Tax=uncultured Sphingomonas sp. TaxID=158754 RepID=UPI0035CBBEFC